MKRKHIFYSGNVQGVGFRYTTVRIAASYDVGGYVRNTNDARVELVVEGTETAVEAFLAEVANLMADYIRDTNVRTENYANEFGTFGIRR